jgi:dolichyl-phosphate beta-glucosyltransferase
MLNATGRVVAFTDADLPYDLDGLKTAYQAIGDGSCEIIFGARDLRESAVLAPRRLARTLATHVFRSIVRQLVSRQITDTQCGLKVFSRRAALELFSRTTRIRLHDFTVPPCHSDAARCAESTPPGVARRI